MSDMGIDKIVILGSLSTNREPFNSIHVFEPYPVGFNSLDEAIRAAKLHYANLPHVRDASRTSVPEYRVYESGDPDGSVYALIEVSEQRGGDMTFRALYKVIAGKYGFRRIPERSSEGNPAQIPEENAEQDHSL